MEGFWDLHFILAYKKSSTGNLWISMDLKDRNSKQIFVLDCQKNTYVYFSFSDCRV
jgi:hypothetical protein